MAEVVFVWLSEELACWVVAAGAGVVASWAAVVAGCCAADGLPATSGSSLRRHLRSGRCTSLSGRNGPCSRRCRKNRGTREI